MTKLKQAARQALEALSKQPVTNHGNWILVTEAITALREALAEQAEQEPVAWNQQRKRNLIKHWAFDCDWGDLTEREIDDLELIINAVLNAAPVRTKDLTDDEIMKINVDTAGIVPTCDRQFHFARAVIAADREKNK